MQTESFLASLVWRGMSGLRMVEMMIAPPATQACRGSTMLRVTNPVPGNDPIRPSDFGDYPRDCVKEWILPKNVTGDERGLLAGLR